MVSPQNLISIYGAILDDSSWQDALESLAATVDAAAATLIHSENHAEVPFRFTAGSRFWSARPVTELSHYEDIYGHYEKQAWDYLHRCPSGTIVYDDEFDSPTALRERPDYRFAIENYGLCHRIGVRLNDNLAWFDALTFQYSANLVAAPAHVRADLPPIIPHVAKAVECGRLIRMLKGRYHAALAALDHVDIGLCVVTSCAEVVVKNETADEIFELKKGLTITRQGVLDCGRVDGVFREAVYRCAQTSGGCGTTSEVLLVASKESTIERNLLIEVSPLNDLSGEVDTGLEGALISIIDPDKTELLDTSKVALAWSLSKAESAVLAMLVSGDTNEIMADKRNVSLETIRSQVKSVYRKTDVRRRSDLLRLVVRTSPPLRKLKN